jgi:uncharacterized protein YpiB (UPF0302 family)
MFIQLNFPLVPPSSEYLAVLEENPFMPKYLHINDKDRLIAEEVLKNSMHSFREENILRQIDEALDTNDKEKFIELSKMLQGMKESSNS